MKRGSIRRRYLIVAVPLEILLEAGATWLRSHRLGGNLVVRCRQGHLFTTVWIPGASVKSLRLGWWRVQYCPVGRHWSVVVPVREDELSQRQLRAARDRHDIRLP
jgi:hypothetical protein